MEAVCLGATPPTALHSLQTLGGLKLSRAEPRPESELFWFRAWSSRHRTTCLSDAPGRGVMGFELWDPWGKVYRYISTSHDEGPTLQDVHSDQASRVTCGKIHRT